MPHKVEEETSRVVKTKINLDAIVEKAAFLLREQEVFLLELKSFKERMERVESKFRLKPKLIIFI